MRAAVGVVLGWLAGTVLLAGCRGGAPVPAPLAWQDVAVPTGVRLTALGSGTPVLVSGQIGTGHAARPVLYRLDGGRLVTVPLRPVTFYGGRAALISVSASGAHVVALGRAFGGAHGNPRFTSWAGDPGSRDRPPGPVRETEQPFEVFGGPSAIAPEQVAAGRGRDLVAGAWAPGGRPAGAAVWSGDGVRWSRDDSAPALRSTTTDQTAAGAVAPRGDGFVVGGSTTHLGGGRIRTRATVFWQASASASWHRLVLPSSAADSQVLAVACVDQTCVVAGSDGGSLAVWRLGADGSARTVPLPATAALPSAGAVVSATAGDDGAWVTASGRGAGVTLLRVRDDAVDVWAAPPGGATAVARSGDQLLALTGAASPDGGGTLRTARVPR